MKEGTEQPERLLYLVQHGEAKPKSEDPDRPLTDTGRETVQQGSDPAPERKLRVTRQAVEVMASDPPPPGLEVTRQGVEVLGYFIPPDPGLEVTRQGIEVLGQNAPGLIVTRQGVEVLSAFPEGTFVSAENDLGVSQAASHNTVAGRSAANILSLADTAAVNRTIDRSASNTLSLSDGAGVSAVYFVNASGSLSLADQAAGDVVKLAHLALILSQQASQTVVRQVTADNRATLPICPHGPLLVQDNLACQTESLGSREKGL